MDLVTGASSGLGQAYARAAWAAGRQVVGTVRRSEDADAYLLDVTDFDAIPRVIERIERERGPIEVLINNAGYGHEGVFEESPLSELRRQFDVNVFGAAAVMQAVLPYMRARRRGRIVNITSMGGHLTMPGIAYYCGSKFALEGISEAVAQEVEPLGIHVTAVAPGSFRTDWAGRSMVRSPRTIADYDAVFDSVRAARLAKSGKQNGDPDRAAQALLQLVQLAHPPRHLLLGSDALQLVREKLRSLQAELERYEALTRSTDY